MFLSPSYLKFVQGLKDVEQVKGLLVAAPNGDIFPCGFLAAQGFKSVNNIREIENWREFWHDMQNNKQLISLRKIGESKKLNHIV